MTDVRMRLTTPFSLYLDLVRFLAAFMVLVEHYRHYGLLRLVPSAGRESVIVFFVLSGFVIAYSTLSKQVSPVDYFAARMTRISSVAIPVLLLAFACAFLVANFGGAELVPGSYLLEKIYIYLPLHLFFGGELWRLSETPPWLSAYWSLGYEVWYYILFGVLCYSRGWRRVFVAALVFAIMGYKLWLLLPVWAAGVWLFQWMGSNALSMRRARLGWLASIVLLVAYNLAGLESQLRALAVSLWPFPQLPLGSAERVLADYPVCALIVLNFACARYAGFESLGRFGNGIRNLSFYTFPLYLAHVLVLGIWRSMRPHANGGLIDFLAVTIVVTAFTWALGRGAERLRISMLSWIAALRPWMAARRTMLGQLAFSDPLAPPESDKPSRIGRKP